jgi:mRNA interferase RelE/StbE
MTYRVDLKPSAAKALRSLEVAAAARIRGAIALLAHDPRPPGARRLAGRPGYRVGVGDYRILYVIEGEVLLIVVVALGHRKAVYRQS